MSATKVKSDLYGVAQVYSVYLMWIVEHHYDCPCNLFPTLVWTLFEKGYLDFLIAEDK